MFQPITSLYAFLCFLFWFMVSKAQLFDDVGTDSLSRAPVGFISRFGTFGDHENYASLGNAPVGAYQRHQYPQPWYQVHEMPVVQDHLPVKPPVSQPCQSPGQCRHKTVKPVVPVRPPLARPYKPVVQPPVKPEVRPPIKPVVRPPMKPVVRPPIRSIVRPPKPYVTQKPKSFRPSTKPRHVDGRNAAGLLGGLLGGIGGGIGGLLGKR